jgi:hypothetical protein
LVYHLITFVQGRGRAGLSLAIYVLWSATLWLGSVLGLAFVPGSLTGVALAHGAASTLTVLALLAWATRYLSVPLYRGLVAPLVAAGTALAAAALVRAALPELDWLRAACPMLVFSLGYVASLYGLERTNAAREIRAALAMLRSE